MSRLRDQAYLRRFPLCASLALNYQCNLNCAVCYIAAQKRSQAPLPAAFWKRIVSESAALGCLHILLTGGECLLHPDFSEIYLHIRRSGMLATVFTNGTLLSKKSPIAGTTILNVFSEAPPSAVEVSVYGASAETWRKVTGEAGGWDACREGVDCLLAAGIKVRLKMLLTDETCDDLPQVRQWAETLGLNFRFDPGLFPAFDGNNTSLTHRLPADEAVAIEFEDDKLREEWIRFHNEFSGRADTGDLYDCGAGRTSFHVEPDGMMQPCLMVRDPAVDLISHSLPEAWRQVVKSIDRGRLPIDSPCYDCDAKVLCGYCPGFFELETGSYYQPSQFFCALGKERLKRVKALSET